MAESLERVPVVIVGPARSEMLVAESSAAVLIALRRLRSVMLSAKMLPTLIAPDGPLSLSFAFSETAPVAGAAMDVHDSHPLAPDSPFIGLPNVLLTPHIGGATVATKERLWREAIAQALQVLRGERPPNLVNADVWTQVERP